MPLTNDQRLAVYQRDRTELTPSQRRRVNKHANLEAHHVVRRASRLRKDFERRDRKERQAEAQQLIGAMSRGVLRPSYQAALRATHLARSIRAAVTRKAA